MRLLTFPGSYEDDRGLEAIEWRVTPTWPVGWAPGFAVSTVIRGVRVRGGDFDTLLPRPRGAGHGLLRWDRIGLVECVLRGDLPITVEAGGVARDAVLAFELDLRHRYRVGRRGTPHAGMLRLTCRTDSGAHTVTDDWFEDGLRALAATLPAGHQLAACFTCAHADYSPAGHGLTGMHCHRDAAPAATCACDPRGVTEEVLETYLCERFRRRTPASPLAGGDEAGALAGQRDQP